MGVPEKVLLLAKPRHQAPGLVIWSYRGPPELSEAVFGLLRMVLPETRAGYLQTYFQIFRKAFFHGVHKNCSWEIN